MDIDKNASETSSNPALPCIFQSASSAKLGALVQMSISENPYALDGHLWCQLSHSERASKLGNSEKQITRLIQKPPFVKKRRKIDGIQTVLLRVGKPEAETDHEVVLSLCRCWRAWKKREIPRRRAELVEKLKDLDEVIKSGSEDATTAALELKRFKATLDTLPNFAPTKDDYGRFHGLAALWPVGLQLQLLQMVLERWPEFIAGASIAYFVNNGDSSAENKFVRYPRTDIIRAHYTVAIEMMEMDYQAGRMEGPVPAALRAIHPHYWRYLKG